MADAKEEVQVRLSEKSVLTLASAIEKYGEEAVFWAWGAVLAPFLPVAGLIASENSLHNAAKRLDVTEAEAMDGIALVGCLKRAADPHQAWLAAEAILRHCQYMEHLRGALAGSAGERQ